MEAAVAIAESGHEARDRAASWLEFFRRFVRLAGPYWRSEEKWPARGLTLALALLTVGQVTVPVALNLWSEDFFDAIENRSLKAFLLLSGVLALIIAGNVAIVTIHLRVKRRLQVRWRRWLTSQLLGRWMAAGRPHQLTQLPAAPDNPDGRIAEDIRIGTEYAIDLAHSLFYCLLLLVSFTNILWLLSGRASLWLGDVRISVPGHLVWIAFLYAGIGVSIALFLGGPLIRAANRRQRCEANFRFGLVHARENALLIALSRGERDERRGLLSLFQGAARAWDMQTTALTHIMLFTSCWSVLSQVFPVLVAAPRYIAGAITLGVLMQTAQAFQQTVAALSWPIDNLPKAAEWRASVERVLGLWEAIDRLQERLPSAVEKRIEVATARGPAIIFRGVSLAKPDGGAVLAGFDARIEAGERVLIAGEPAAAAMLFKAATGVWPWGSGRIELPSDGDVFFMPQRPYLPIGPLRRALADLTPESHDDARLAACLARVGLEHLIPRLDETATWDQALSAAEQQRLGFARLLLYRPRWIFSQQATDALDADGEEAMMRLLAETLPKAGVITIGHHAGLEAHHRRKFTLARVNGAIVVEETPLPAPS